MVMLKSCPRCVTGDVVLDKDMYGHNVQCLQCGYMRDVEEGSQLDSLLVGLHRKSFTNLNDLISSAVGEPQSLSLG